MMFPNGISGIFFAQTLDPDRHIIKKKYFSHSKSCYSKCGNNVSTIIRRVAISTTHPHPLYAAHTQNLCQTICIPIHFHTMDS